MSKSYKEFFYYDGKRYEIVFPEKVAWKSVFLRRNYEDDFKSDYFLLDEHDNIPDITELVVDGLFDVDFYTNCIKLIFGYIETRDGFSEEMSSMDPLKKDFDALFIGERLLIRDLFDLIYKIKSSSRIELLYRILNTHYAMFDFFHYFEIAKNAKDSEAEVLNIKNNIGILILGEFFSFIIEEFKNEFEFVMKNYFCLWDSKFTADYEIMEFIKEKRVEKNKHAIVPTSFQNFVDKIKTEYIKYSFLKTYPKRAMHALLQSDHSDENLHYYKNYFLYRTDNEINFHTDYDMLKHTAVTYLDASKMIELFDGIDSSKLEHLILPSVTTIGNGFLDGCKSLRVVELPNSLISIGNYFLHNCDNLERINISNSLVFIGNSFLSACSDRLKTVILPDTVTTIGYDFLRYCENLETVKLSNSLISIDNDFLYSCKCLKTIKLPDSLITIGDYFMSRCDAIESIKLPNSVTTIGKKFSCFSKNLKTIELPDSLTSINDDFLYGCISLESIKLPKYLITIGDSFLHTCVKIKAIKLPKSLTTVGDDFLSSCTMLESIKLPDSLSKIGDSFLEECTGLESIKMSNSITTMSKKFLYHCSNLETIDLPENLVTISSFCLSGCKKLKKIKLPNTVTTVGMSFLSGCYRIRKLELSDSILTIDYGFSDISIRLHKFIVPSHFDISSIKLDPDCIIIRK